MDPNVRKQAPEPEQVSDLDHAPEVKRPTTDCPLDGDSPKMENEKFKIAENLNVSLSPSKLWVMSPPDYLVQEQLVISQDNMSQLFYSNCKTGMLDEIRDFVESSNPSQADLQYGLTMAADAYQIEVVRYLVLEKNTKLHSHAFRPIFKQHSPRLWELLKVFLDRGWNPNIVLSRPQCVALHSAYCVQDMKVLRLLLEHGADPGIENTPHFCFSALKRPPKSSFIHQSGDVLDIAATVGSTEAIDLLLAYGAKLEHGRTLHSLARSDSKPDEPVDPVRLKMANYLLGLGEDVNGPKDVGDLVLLHGMLDCFPHRAEVEMTPLYFAAALNDWAFAEWLLEKGAEPVECGGSFFQLHKRLYWGPREREPRILALAEKVNKTKSGVDMKVHMVV